VVRTIAKPLYMKNILIQINNRIKENLAPQYSNGQIVENCEIPILVGAGALMLLKKDPICYSIAS
jgi:hypothetical protein